MANLNKFLFLSATTIAVLCGLFNFLTPAYAMTPTLSLSSTGGGDNVQINVIGDPGVSVLLFAGSQTPVLGSTNSSGNFSAIVSSATYGLVSNAVVYVKTGGINGSQSNSVSWPYVQNSTTNTNLTLSQTALLLNAGQTSTITASASYLYLMSNSSPAVANVNFNAAQVTVQALTYGSTVANICVVGSTTNCASVNITVQNSSAQQLTFSQNNFSIISGQSATATIYGGSGYYIVSNNSNSGSIQTNLTNSTITLTATSTTGAAAITVCTTDMNYCGIINVSSTASNSTAVTFSQTNPVVAVGQSTTVTIYGGSGNSFYVSSNSNPSSAQININGNILTLVGIANGTSNISVCAMAGSCGSIIANVSSTANTGGPISLSQTTVSIMAGQNSNITILGGSTPYSISSSTPNIFNGVINGNILTIYGVNAGSSTANICSSVGCTTLYVTINSTASTINPPTFSQNNILLNVGQQTTISVAGTGSYYISNNSNSNIASEQINGSSIVITAIASGATNVSICQSGGQCATLYITVSGTTNTATVQPVLSQSSLSLASGQSATVSISGTGNYYIGGNSNLSIASANISASTVAVSAITAGNTNISVCQNGGQCATLYVTVSGTTNTVAQLILSQSSLSMTPGQNTTVYATGSGSYYVASNSTPSVASVTISGSSVVVSALGYGTDNISICQSGGQCVTLSVSVSISSSQPSTNTPVAVYVFPRYLGSGDKGEDVFQLQKFLVQQGFLSVAPTGHYGPATVAAVKKFQKAHSIKQTGSVGPATKDALNQNSISTSTTGNSTMTKEQQASSIQQAIQQLLAQVAQMQGK